MPDLTIRRAAAADADALAELALRSFLDAFAAQNEPEDIAAYTARTYGPARQAAELANPDILTLVGEVDGRAVARDRGHVAEADGTGADLDRRGAGEGRCHGPIEHAAGVAVIQLVGLVSQI